MASVEHDAVKGLLQTLENVLDGMNRLSVAAGQLLNAQRSGRPLADSVLAHYDQQLQTTSDQRARMREIIGKRWTMVETPAALKE